MQEALYLLDMTRIFSVVITACMPDMRWMVCLFSTGVACVTLKPQLIVLGHAETKYNMC